MTNLEKALSYAKAGIAVIPCEPANKEPIWALVPKDIGPDRKPVPRTGGVKKATRDTAKIIEWWEMRPDAMIGGATGEASGFWAIDPDVPKPKKNGHAGEFSPDGAAAWEKLKAKYGGHAQTVEVTTPSGGRHIYFRCDPARPSGNREGNLSGLGINVRGNGGYVILPPSRRWPDGKAYEATRPINPAAIAEAPAWLYDLIRPARKQSTPGAFPWTPDNERNLRDALSTIPADARDMWLKIGGALHALGPEWSGTARRLWDEWSQSEPGSFDPEDQEATWQRFDPAHPNGATVGTIFFEAKERGWRKARNGEDRNEGYLPLGGDVQKPPSRVVGAGTFMRSYEAISYTIDGMLPSGYLYGLTGRQGTGKTALKQAAAIAVAMNRADVLGCCVEPGRVGYVTIENPVDFKMKFSVNCFAHNISYDEIEPRVAIIDGRDTPEQIYAGLKLDAEANGPFQLVCFDTFQAGFAAANAGVFNDNGDVLKYVGRLRPLTTLPGSPSVLVAFHPIKNATEDDLFPYGGGAIMNEIDGNLTLWNAAQIKLYWNRVRGPQFEPRYFRIEKLSCPDILDNKGRQIELPVLRPCTEMDVAERKKNEGNLDIAILRAMAANPDGTQLEWAFAIGIKSKSAVNTRIQKLKVKKLVEERLDGKWRLTPKGQKEVASLNA